MRYEVRAPWRASDAWRTRAWSYVSNHLTKTGHHPTPVDAGGERFSRAASRNLAMRSDADVVILTDADMVAPPNAYRAMAQLASDTGRMVVGYSEYRALSKRSTSRVLNGADPFLELPAGVTRDWSTGGIIAMTPHAWRRVGGMDERFVGWGCEDFAFAHAAAVTLGPVVRVTTPAVHLWHPLEQGHDQLDDNAELMARYLATRTVADLNALKEDRANVR